MAARAMHRCLHHRAGDRVGVDVPAGQPGAAFIQNRRAGVARAASGFRRIGQVPDERFHQRAQSDADDWNGDAPAAHVGWLAPARTIAFADDGTPCSWRKGGRSAQGQGPLFARSRIRQTADGHRSRKDSGVRLPVTVFDVTAESTNVHRCPTRLRKADGAFGQHFDEERYASR